MGVEGVASRVERVGRLLDFHTTVHLLALYLPLRQPEPEPVLADLGFGFRLVPVRLAPRAICTVEGALPDVVLLAFCAALLYELPRWVVRVLKVTHGCPHGLGYLEAATLAEPLKPLDGPR